MSNYVLNLAELDIRDVALVGEKNAFLGETTQNLTQQGIQIPIGFATTAQAYRDFLAQNQLNLRIASILNSLDIDDITSLTENGRKIRQWILDMPFQTELEQAIRQAYQQLMLKLGPDVSFAVRSSAMVEDLAIIFFAGKQKTSLNIKGINAVLIAIKQIFASLFNDQAMAYKMRQGFKHTEVALSASIQQMIRSDLSASGVMLSSNAKSGFNHTVWISSSYGLGATTVQRTVQPDQFYVYKPNLARNKASIPSIRKRHLGSKRIQMIYANPKLNCEDSVQLVEVDESLRQKFSISDQDAEQLARYAVKIEQYYQCPMEIKWAKDGITGQIYIVKVRPKTSAKSYQFKEY